MNEKRSRVIDLKRSMTTSDTDNLVESDFNTDEEEIDDNPMKKLFKINAGFGSKVQADNKKETQEPSQNQQPELKLGGLFGGLKRNKVEVENQETSLKDKEVNE